MPPPDGFETCRRIKANPLLGAIPVMFMTGLSDTAHVVEGLRAGGVDYVTKPIMLDELIARIHVHIANARMMRSAQAALDVTGRSEEHTSELQSLMRISYAVFCLKKKKQQKNYTETE